METVNDSSTKPEDNSIESEHISYRYIFIWILFGGLIVGVAASVFFTLYFDKKG